MTWNEDEFGIQETSKEPVLLGKDWKIGIISARLWNLLGPDFVTTKYLCNLGHGTYFFFISSLPIKNRDNGSTSLMRIIKFNNMDKVLLLCLAHRKFSRNVSCYYM